jgi:hypothetical protein
MKKLSNEKEALSQREIACNVNKSEFPTNINNYQNVPLDYFKSKKNYFSGSQIPGANDLQQVSLLSRHPNTHDANNHFAQVSNKKLDSCEAPYFFNPTSKNMYNSHELLTSLNIGEVENIRGSLIKTHEKRDKLNPSRIPSLASHDEHDKTVPISHLSNSDIENSNVFCRDLATPVQRVCIPSEKSAQTIRCPPAPMSSPIIENKATKESDSGNCCDALTLLNAVVRSLTNYPKDASGKSSTMHNDLAENHVIHQETENVTVSTSYNIVEERCTNVPLLQEGNLEKTENVQTENKGAFLI